MNDPDPDLNPFNKAFRAELGDAEALSWQSFSRLALYHPEVGYYRRPRERVGRTPTSDFYTSSSLGSLFTTLLVDSFRHLLKTSDLREYSLYEIGPEPGQQLFPPLASQFKATHVLRPGDSQAIEGKAILFANELLDAQPFHRLQFDSQQGWQVCGVKLTAGELQECYLDEPDPQLQQLIQALPTELADGYRFDISLASEALIDDLFSQPWNGLFLFFDYGATWNELVYETPQGSARAYTRHRQSNKLLEQPGEQDLTCHVCWDRLQDAVRRHGIHHPLVSRQESFFMQHATHAIARIISESPEHFSPQRRTLQELIHPSYFGHRFQAFFGSR